MNNNKPFRILVVCTGNVCRSPLVERLLQQGLDKVSSSTFEVRSAGTQALVGHSMTPQITGLARVLGADHVDFVSRQLSGELLTGQNLVLALTRQHRSRILEIAPRLLKRTFTLREFGRMVRFTAQTEDLDHKGAANAYTRWEELLPLAASSRHEVMGTSSDDDVVDPYRKDDAVHQRMVEQIFPAVQSIIGFERDAVRQDSDRRSIEYENSGD